MYVLVTSIVFYQRTHCVKTHVYPFNHYTQVCKTDPSDCTHIGEILISSIIAEQEARQLIVVQGSRISASVYLYVCMYVYL